MCGAPVVPARGAAPPADGMRGPRLCSSVRCAYRYAAIPVSQRCKACAAPLSPASRGRGLCDTPGCAASWQQQQIANDRAASRAELQAAIARRNRSAARRGIAAAARDSYRVAIIPRNDDRSTRLPVRRRNTFLQRLRANIAVARARIAAGEDRATTTASYDAIERNGRSDAELAAEVTLMNTGCASCRGSCCQQGGDHAFNSPETVMRYLEQWPTHDDETIVSRYTGHFTPRTMSRGCVFQHTAGCALPRDLRSDICNRYYCNSIMVLRNAFRADDPVGAYFIHDGAHASRPGEFVQIAVRRAAGHDLP